MADEIRTIMKTMAEYCLSLSPLMKRHSPTGATATEANRQASELSVTRGARDRYADLEQDRRN